MSITSKKFNNKNKYRFRVYYKDIYGNRQRYESKWYDSKKECKEDEAHFIANKKNKKTGLTFKEMALQSIEYDFRNNENKPKTYKDKISMINHKLTPINDCRIDDISTAMIKQLFEQEEISSLGTSRKNRVRGLINSVFKYGQLFYDLNNNPIDKIPPFKKSIEEKTKEMTIYTQTMFNEFLGNIPDTHDEYKKLFFVLYWTGARLNEINSLTFQDIHQNKIVLRKQFQDGKWSSLKTVNSQRNIAIDQSIYSVFVDLENKYRKYPSFSRTWFCFGGPRQLPYSTIEEVKNRAIESSNLPYVRIHDFRHSHASNLIEAGVNIYKISKRLGHSSISVTLDIYGHLIDTDGDEILNAIKIKD